LEIIEVHHLGSPLSFHEGDFNSAVLKDAERESTPSMEGRMTILDSDE
jgi:hypothetical protein